MDDNGVTAAVKDVAILHGDGQAETTLYGALCEV
jgi:hypothetical protein